MDKKPVIIETPSQQVDSDLEAMLAAWHCATEQLEHSHEALREEVDRLNTELRTQHRGITCKNRFAELGQTASRVAGEMRNNLVPVTLNLSLLRRRIADDPIGLNILGKVEDAVTTVEATMNDLARYVSDREPRWCTFSLTRVIDEIIASLTPRLTTQSVDVIIDVPPSQSVHADRDMTRQALLNLVLNALDAMPDGGTLTMTSAFTERGLEIEIADTGPGLAEAARAHVFEPFFTTKSSATGLGLTTVHRMIEAHGGYVTAMNCPDGGAAFTLCLPQQRVLKMAA